MYALGHIGIACPNVLPMNAMSDEEDYFDDDDYFYIDDGPVAEAVSIEHGKLETATSLI